MQKSSELIRVVELGHVLRVDVDAPRGQALKMEWNEAEAAPLLWCPKYKCLYFSDIEPSNKADGTTTKMQLACYREWHDMDPQKARVDTYDVRGEWQKIGVVRRIDYHSTKWFEDQEYTHASRGGSYLYSLGGSKAAFYAIQGKMRATERGLIK